MFTSFKSNLPRNVMLADGGICLIAGIGLATASAPIAGLLGPALASGRLVAIGAFLIAWGAFHLIAGGAARISPNAMRLAATGDGLWILGSVALLVVAGNTLTGVGVMLVAAQTVAVASIMLIKLAGIGTLRTPAAT